MVLDEKEETQGVETSEDTTGTSGKNEETFTKSQMDKAKSDVLAAAGRTAKSLEKREDALKKAEEKAERLERERYEADKLEAKDDTDKLDAIERGRRERERKAELLKREAELEDREEKVKGVEDVARKAEIREAAMKLALKHDVDIESLVEFAGNLEKMEDLAKLLPRKGETQTLKVDSGKTIGGSGKLTVEQVRKMSPEERLARSEEIKDMPLGIA